MKIAGLSANYRQSLHLGNGARRGDLGYILGLQLTTSITAILLYLHFHFKTVSSELESLHCTEMRLVTWSPFVLD